MCRFPASCGTWPPVPTAVTCANAALAGMGHSCPLDDVVALMLAVGEKIRPCDEAGTYILKKEEA